MANSKRAVRKAPPRPRRRRQYAVIPIRLTRSGEARVMLLTSRETGRWVIPKGWLIRRLGPAGTAKREAYEEAGLKGRLVSRTPIGTYSYRKRGPGETLTHVTVTVFLMRLGSQLSDWPERGERKTKWFKPRDAASRVAEASLRALLRRVPRLVGKSAQ